MQIEYSLFLFFLIINTRLLLAQLHRARVQRSCDREHVRFLNTPLGRGTRSFPAPTAGAAGVSVQQGRHHVCATG